jgi:VanZ family protein
LQTIDVNCSRFYFSKDDAMMQVSHVYTFIHQYCLTINVHCSRFCFSYFELFTSLITLQLLFIAVLAAHSAESVRTCIDVILHLFLTIFLSNFETVPTVWYFLPHILLYRVTSLRLALLSRRTKQKESMALAAENTCLVVGSERF